MTFRDFVQVLRARWRILLVSLLVVLGTAAMITIVTTPVYTASAKVYLSTDRPKLDAPASISNYVITRSDLVTFAEVLTAPSVLEKLYTAADVPTGTAISVSAAVSETTNMLLISASGSDPQVVASVANAAGPVLAEAAPQFAQLLAVNGQIVTSKPVAPATVPSRPTSPNPIRNLTIGAFAGLMAGLGLALMRHTLDTKIRNASDIGAISPRPLLGEIPLVKGATTGLLSLESDPHGRHAEAIRRLRTNLLFVDVTTGGHSFVITSSVPSEGKTTTSVNLAMAMADAGSRVLLIDGDLRNPSVASALGIEGSFGLTTILLGQADPEDVVQQWGATSFFVLPAGQIPPNPSELLGSVPMEQLFGKLSHDFDFILVDSPPVVPVIDAVLINKLTHGLIMVVAADRTRKRDLASAVHSLGTVDAQIAGFALNLLPVSGSATYRYGYYGHNATAATMSGTAASRGDRRRVKSRSRSRL